jgi:hypothetical protein
LLWRFFYFRRGRSRTAASAAHAATAHTTAATHAASAWAATTRTTAAPRATARNNWFRRQQALALQLLARELTRPANGLSLFASTLFRWLFEVIAELHLAENALALKLLFERLKGLVNVVVANENLQAKRPSIC